MSLKTLWKKSNRQCLMQALEGLATMTAAAGKQKAAASFGRLQTAIRQSAH